MFDEMKKLKACFAFLINLFVGNVVNDGCTMPEPLAVKSSVVKMKLMELQKLLECKDNS